MLSFFLYLISLYCFSSFTTHFLQKIPPPTPTHLQCFSEPNSIILDFAVWYCDLNIWSWRLLSLSKCSFCVRFLSPSLNLLLHLSCLHIYFYCSQVLLLRLLVTHNSLYGSKSTLGQKSFSHSIGASVKKKKNITEPIRPHLLSDFITN